MQTFLVKIVNGAGQVEGSNLITYLRREQREKLTNDGRWSLFARNSPNMVHAGSLLTVEYKNSLSSQRCNAFTGVLLAVRRNVGNPTILLRSVIDGIGVEQIFSILSPLIQKIEVVKRATLIGRRKLYFLRDKPALIPLYTLPKAEQDKLYVKRKERQLAKLARERPKRGPRKFYTKESPAF